MTKTSSITENIKQFAERGAAALSILIAAGLVTGCVVADVSDDRVDDGMDTVGDTRIAVPGLYTYDDKQPVTSIVSAESATVVIYLHGTKDPKRASDCDSWANQVPESIAVLKDLPNTHILFLCSRSRDRGIEGSFISKRAAEVEGVLDQLVAAGIQPARIFLAGHSAGGWVALMLMRDSAPKFNAAIAFGPACCGKREDEPYYPRWRTKIRPEQVTQMLEARQIRALVFAYEDDPFNRPQDLNFLTDKYPESVRLIGYDCGGGHNTHIDDCRLKDSGQIISEYIASRTQDFQTVY